MSDDRIENIGFVTRLLRKQRSLRKRPIQFTLGSFLVCVGYLACLLWWIQFVIRTQQLDIPLFMHLWFLILWTSVLGGAFISHDARSYLIGGAIGLGLASPLLLMVYVNDLDAVPLTTGWACSFVFAMFANLGGAISCIRNGIERLAVLHVATFACTILMVIVYFDT